jgi:hypothetical protein
VDRRGGLRVMQGLRRRAFHPCAEWASYTVTSLRRDVSGDCSRDAPPAVSLPALRLRLGVLVLG